MTPQPVEDRFRRPVLARRRSTRAVGLFPMVRCVAFACAILLAAGCVSRAAASFEWTKGGPYDGEGAVVETSAESLGMLSMVVVGAPAAAVCVPGDLVYSAVRWEWKFGVLSDRCAEYVGGAAGWTGYVIGGAPFFLLKKVLWDAPRALLGVGAASPEAVPDEGTEPQAAGTDR
jgi:hypothetical protein